MKSFRLNTCHDPQRTVAVRFDTGCITSGADQIKAINLPGMLSGVRIAERKERVAVVPGCAGYTSEHGPPPSNRGSVRLKFPSPGTGQSGKQKIPTGQIQLITHSPMQGDRTIVYKLLGGSRSKIITDITISVNSPEEMARDARNAVDRGYDTLKIKVGADLSLDVARLMAVRKEVGDNIRIRIDANQAWSPKQAVKLLNQMQDKGLDGPVLCSEDPILGGAVFNEREITVSNDPGLGIHGIQGIRYLAD